MIHLHAHQPAQQLLKCNAIWAVSQIAEDITFDGVACYLLRAFLTTQVDNTLGLSPIAKRSHV